MSRPLVVDLDGTVLRSDILVEVMLRYMRNGMGAVFQLPLWLLKGRVVLKQERGPLDVEVLPYNEVVIGFLRHARKADRTVVLGYGISSTICRADHRIPRSVRPCDGNR